MNTIVGFYRKHFDVIFLSFGIIVMLTVLLATFFTLPNNLFCDEGWYLCLLRDTPHVGQTRYHLLFHNVFNNNIYAIRLACWLSQLIGSLVLSFGITLWIRCYFSDIKVSVLFLFALCTLYFGQMDMITCPSFNYIIMNKVIAEVGIGLMLIGLVRRNMVCFVLSGFMISFLFPTMITNVVIIPIMFIVILCLSDNKRRDGLGFVSGVVLFFLYYFIFVESPKEVIRFLMIESNKVVERGSGDYGMKFYVQWLMHMLCYYVKCFIVAAILFAINNKLKGYAFFTNKRKRLLAMVVVSVLLIIYMWTFLNPSLLAPFPYKEYGSIIWYRDLYWIYIFMLLLSVFKSIDTIGKDKLLLCGLFMVAPLCLCLGSNLLFNYRQSAYFVFIMPIIVFLTMKKNVIWKSLILVILVGGFVVFCLSILGRNSDGDRWFGGHVPVKTIGIQQNVKLSQDQLSRLVTCENHVPKGSRVLTGFMQWWTVPLLDYIPITYSYNIFRDNPEMLQSIVDDEIENKGHIWVISNTWEEGLIEKIDMIQGYEKKVDTIGNDLFYYFSSN